MSKRFRNWVFTLNNPTSFPEKELDDEWWQRFKGLKYGCCQLERGNAEGTLHLQGYLEFRNAVTGAAIQKSIPGAYHSRRNGTAVEARTYCRKEATRTLGPWEWGEFKEEVQGKRSDLEEVKTALDDGKNEMEIAEEYFGTWCRNWKAIARYKEMHEQVRTVRTEWEIHIGVPGTGKTTSVDHDNPGAYWKSPNNKWWDGYNGQEVVVLDEFKGWLTYMELLRLGDATPLRLEVKGGNVQFRAKKCILISNYFPWEWYNFEESKLDKLALFRRIDIIVYHRKDKESKMWLDWNDFCSWCLKKGFK